MKNKKGRYSSTLNCWF